MDPNLGPNIESEGLIARPGLINEGDCFLPEGPNTQISWCTCEEVHTYTTNILAHIHIHLCIYVCTYTQTDIHIYIPKHTCIHVYLSIHMDM